MRRNKYSALLLAALATGAVWATVSQTADRHDRQQEKVRPSESLMHQAPAPRVHYPALKAEGSADGVPYGLGLMGVTDKTVQLTWISPEPTDGYFDDFESHEDFAVNSAGNIGWSYIDADNKSTYTWQACTFPTQGQKMAFVVMNPWMTSPAVNENPDYQPYSGKKMLVDFCAVDAQNNDYIISPELNFDQDFQISFMARSYKVSDNIAAERIRVGYSTTGRQPSDFKYVNDGPYVELPAEWTLVKYTIPKEAKYVTVNCVSDDAFMLMIDDIFVGTNQVRPGSAVAKAAAANPLVGFNVYRDGQKVNQLPVDQIRYTDTVDDYGSYNYTVTAVYKDGTESAQSQPLSVEVPDIRLLPFEDDFDDWTLHEDKWTTEQADQSSEIHWSIDYYEYGLVDPSATYKWSNDENYDQSLVTRELHTTDRSNTYLRFNLRLRNSQLSSVDYLSAEVTSDGGQTWQELKTYDNRSGSFDWTTCQFSLGDVLKSDLFRVRFRAHGANAKWINYWYVDDVKVWNPVWTSASLHVATAEGPVADCPVTLTADQGAVVNATTDAKGQIQLSQIEEGKYTVRVIRDGYNVYSGEWNVAKGSTNDFTARLTRPAVSLSATSVAADIVAESNTVRTLTLRNTGDGPMVWHLADQPAKQSGDVTHQWQPQTSFKTSGDLQQSIAFDGEFYYTTSSVELGKFWKYDKDGQLIEQFSIPEMYYRLYDLTYDGRYFYGSDYSNRLFKLDFDNRRVVDIITVADQPSLKITHCSYDPDRKGFWIGGFGTVAFMHPNGKLGSQLTSFDSDNSVSVYGSAYDNITPGGPYLWLADMTSANSNMIDKLQIRQYNLSTRTLTDVKHVLTDAPGYRMGDATSGENYVCGLFASTDIKPGTLTLLGVLNQSPNLVFRYTLCEFDKWLSLSPKHGTLAAGAEQPLTVGLDALAAKSGDSFTGQATLLTLPETADQSLSFTLNAVGESATPRPQQVKAEAAHASVTLTWQQGNGSARPEGYNIYRDNVKVNAQPVSATTYTDSRRVYGSYSYKVSAVYAGGKESALSDSVSVFVKDGAQYYAPIRLSAAISHNKDVALQWQSPLAQAGRRDTMTWATGAHEDQIGLDGGGFFYAGAEWDAEDIVPYRGKSVTSVSIQLVNLCTYLSLNIYKDGERIYNRRYTGTILYDGRFTEVPVETPVTLEPGHTYRFAFMVMNDDGVQPVGLDASTSNGKGDLLSLDGKEWFSAAQSGLVGNINLRVNVAPATSTVEQTPVGYNVYRDGHQVNEAPVSVFTYTDELPATGTHAYRLTSVYADGGESAPCEPVEVVAYDIREHHAPYSLNATVVKNRNVSLRWAGPTAAAPVFEPDLQARPVTTDAGYPEFVRSFTGSKSEMAVATDGKHVYTSIYNEDGVVNRYSLGGEFLGSFKIAGLDGIRNMTFDGTHFYVGDNGNNIYQVDMDSHAVLDTIAISEYARHLAYVPELDNGRGGFEVGDWETSIYVARNGSKLATGPALKGAAGTACVDGKLYAFEQGGEANAYTIGVYDMATGQRTGDIDMGRYQEIPDMASVTAGGMSSFTAADGTTYLLMALQRRGDNTRLVVLDISSQPTIAGYNVFRDGQQLNAEPVSRRYYAETLSQEGDYQYTVQTVYIDGSTSAQSTAATATIVASGEAKVPVDVKAVPSSYGYDVLLSFADPDMYAGASRTDNFETALDGAELYAVSGASYASRWYATSDCAFGGVKAIKADKHDAAFGVIPAEGMGYLRLAARNADDHEGSGTLDVYYSKGGTHRENFIYLTSYTTSEAWQDIVCQLPEGTEYVAVAKAASAPATYVDGVALYREAPQSQVYGFDIFRNGEQINTEPVQTISYTDHNLLPGHYEYQVRLTTLTAAVSELSDKVGLDLSYDNGSLAPTNLTAAWQSSGDVRLSWQMPALGEPIWLRWHDGNSYDAAGLPNGGAFYAAVQWFASDLKGYGHLALSDVEVYINQIPEALFLLVYENNTLVRQQYVPTLKQYAFNTIHLDEPLKVNTEKNLRVAVYVEHNEISVPLGYDKGPARSGRGDLYSTDGITWSTMEDSGADIDANWNISIGLSPYSAQLPGVQKAAGQRRRFVPKATATGARLTGKAAQGETSSTKNVFEGYNIYRNGQKLNATLTTDTTYTDRQPVDGKYLQYQVAAVYSSTGEQKSDKVTLTVSAIGDVEAEGHVRVEAVGTDLHIYGAHAGDALTVISAGGQTVYRGRVDEGYHTVVPMRAHAAGTYVVRVGDAAYKVVR